MKVAFAQINPIVGDLIGNTKKILDIISLNSRNCDIIIFPEMVLTGYPAQDLLLETQFIKFAQNQLNEIADSVKYSHVIFKNFILLTIQLINY